MFAAMAAVNLPVALASTREPADWLQAYSSAPTLGFLGILVFLCTFGGYLLMNRWQRGVTVTQAGLIYCLEPVFASGFALFLPAWFSTWAAIDYANEKLTLSLLVGGGLITAANVLIQLPSCSRSRGASQIGMPVANKTAGRVLGQLDDTPSM
jgi:drug/metabolite transporter (DMT)-like permease